jgi:hypothetical protein
MRRFVLSQLLLTALLACDALPQATPPHALTHTVARAEWDIRSVGDVRFGRVALVADPDGPRLEVRRLWDILPTVPQVSMQSLTPSFSGNSFVVGDFARANRTPLGGYFGTFHRPPSLAAATVGRSPDGRRALELTCQRETAGFCGLWIQLYDFEAAPDARRYFDSRAFSTVSFWIRGHSGGERLQLKAADAEWEMKEDALPVGDVAEFLPAGRVDTVWQQAVVPVDRFPSRIERARLAMIVFEATAAGTSSVDLGPVAFSMQPDGLPPLPEPERSAESVRVPHKATWVWNTAELLDDSDGQAELLDFLERDGFDRVFLQLPGVAGQPSDPGELQIDAVAMRPLVAAFHRRGMRVYALDGYAPYALPEFHDGVLKTVDHVIRYNRQSAEQERFYGIRYDIEPYLLPAFHGPRRAVLLQGLLELTAKSAARARSGGLAYGADIPFWYDTLSDDTYERVTVEFRGVDKPVNEHIIDLADDVAIMDYRTVAYGADGTIRHASGELEYAAALGKPVFVALETFELPDEVLLDFRGEPRRGLPETAPAEDFVVLAPARDSVHVAYVAGALEPGDAGLVAITQWMERQGLDPHVARWWPVSKRVEVPADKITFARHDARRLEAVMEGTAVEFQRYSSFAGFALHYAQSYMELVGNGARPR